MILALLAAIGYTAYAGARVYQDLDGGRGQLVDAQASMNAASQSNDPGPLQVATNHLTLAQHDFEAADRRLRGDPALRLVSGIPTAGRQIEGAAHLAGLGADLSRAGKAAAVVAAQVQALKQKYAGRRLTADDLQSVLQQAQAIASTYSQSIKAIGTELKAAHVERAAVTTTDLLPPLQTAYTEADRALAAADTAFLRYQDVRQVLSGLLGVGLPG